MRLQRMLGHFTHLIPKNPANALVIGCGAGVTAGAVSIGPGVKHETIAEIEPLVPGVGVEVLRRVQLQRRRQPEGHRPHRRRAALPADDEPEVRRDYVRSARPVGQGRGDALHGEFFDIVKKHLNPGGVVTLFVQLYESNTAAVKSEIGTFLESVPERRRVGQHEQRQGLRPRADGAGRRRRRSTSTRCRRSSTARSTRRSRSRSARSASTRPSISSRTTRGRPPDLAPWLKDAEINHDRNLRLQYPRRAGPESVSERTDLRGHDSVREVPGGAVHRIAGVDPGRARRDPAPD